jgi:hypothetical protein
MLENLEGRTLLKVDMSSVVPDGRTQVQVHADGRGPESGQDERLEAMGRRR